jgi:hypothetical protein
VYAFGGWTNGGVLLGHSEFLAQGGVWTEFESLLTPRASLMAAAANGHVYAIGGWNGVSPFATVEEYDPATGDWTQKQPMPTARSEAGVAVVGGVVYVVGGTTDGTDVLNAVEFYDPVADSWSAGTPIPTARAMAGCAVAGSDICVFGGVGPGLVNTHAVEVYNPARDTWTREEPLPSSRRSLSGLSLLDSQVYAVGGLDSLMQATALTERWDPPAAVHEFTQSSPLSIRESRVCRTGNLIRPPFDERPWRVAIRSCDGRTVGAMDGDAGLVCPDLSRGVYLLDWRAGRSFALTRLVVAD